MTASPSRKSLPEFSISEETKRKIFSGYIECLKQACDVFRVNMLDMDYSERELALAVAEAEIDIRAMFARRSVTHGIAPQRKAAPVDSPPRYSAATPQAACKSPSSLAGADDPALA